MINKTTHTRCYRPHALRLSHEYGLELNLMMSLRYKLSAKPSLCEPRLGISKIFYVLIQISRLRSSPSLGLPNQHEFKREERKITYENDETKKKVF